MLRFFAAPGFWLAEKTSWTWWLCLPFIHLWLWIFTFVQCKHIGKKASFFFIRKHHSKRPSHRIRVLKTYLTTSITEFRFRCFIFSLFIPPLWKMFQQNPSEYINDIFSTRIVLAEITHECICIWVEKERIYMQYFFHPKHPFHSIPI